MLKLPMDNGVSLYTLTGRTVVKRVTGGFFNLVLDLPDAAPALMGENNLASTSRRKILGRGSVRDRHLALRRRLQSNGSGCPLTIKPLPLGREFVTI